MLFYIALFLIFLYFKLARVYNKEEQVSTNTYIIHIIVAISVFALYGYGFKNYSYLPIAISSFVFFITAALMITAVQVGIFIDGKPFIGIGRVYKSMPILAGVIAILTILVWLI